ncbi:hypothetical protein N7G274_001628 [Stereocaulon virgatum]|uniref:BTB domain-containing protein n=1 Tax=Stereocaulon virgatum TaxID=373712 RepID=A0ABR4AL08_9LECA
MSTAARKGPFTGPIFELIAGSKCKAVFHVHASVLVKLEKLKALVEGGWEDSTARKIELEDWDEDTVARLVEWLYTGRYTCPSPGSDTSDEVAPLTNDKQYNDIGNTCELVAPLRTDPTKTHTSLMHIRFRKSGCVYQFGKTTDARWKRAERTRKKSGLDSTTLADAKVYVFADYMLLPGLQAFAFEGVAARLIWMGSFTPNTQIISDIVALAEYVYANTVKPCDHEEPLRELISTYIAMDFDLFHDEGGLVERLIDQGGAIAVDVWEKARTNIGVLRKENEELKRKMSETKATSSKTNFRKRYTG